MPGIVYRLHHFVTLVADMIIVNSVPFLVTLSRKIKLQTVEHVPNHTAALLSSSQIKVIKMYQRGVFIVNLILMDQEFNKLEEVIESIDGSIGNVEIHTTAAHKYMGKI